MRGKSRPSGTWDKDDYDLKMKSLRTELGELQRAIRKSAIPVMILFEGLQASGKSEMVNELIRALDPRCFRVHAIEAPTVEEAAKPFLWRFWNHTPPGGRMDIYDEGWYGRLLAEKIRIGRKKGPLSSRKEQKALSMIIDFERQLTAESGREEANPYLLVKFFLRISKEEQRGRLEKLEKDKTSMFLTEPPDWKAHKHYGDYTEAFDRMIQLSDSTYAPWHIIEADDRRFATVTVYEALIASLKGRLGEGWQPDASCVTSKATGEENEAITGILNTVDMDRSLPEPKYRELLKVCQQELKELQLKAYRKKIPAVIVFEGMDASGKGGSIKRLSESFDPRRYKVVPVGVPNTWETAHHYLWRFWIHFPAKGYTTIFDRSWYGRVLVERIERLAPENCWRQAYDEINRMEEALSDNGTAIAKLWLHIDPQVEYDRFVARESDPAKSWKLGASDWRNRSHWDEYMGAAEEMIRRTSTDHAPWTIIPSNDKLFSRIAVMDTVIDTMKKSL